MRYTVIDIESGETVTFCTYEGCSLHDALEEALYVTWELEPADRDWFRQLANECCCEFRYGTSERFIVSYGWDGELHRRQVGRSADARLGDLPRAGQPD